MSGVELKEPVLSNALKQPFSTTGMLSCLMASCEQKAKELECTTGGLDTLLHTFPQYECLFLIKCASVSKIPCLLRHALAYFIPERSGHQRLVWYRETEAALDVWSDLRSNASTPSTFLDPRLLNALTATRDVSNASTSTKRKRGNDAAAAPSEAVAEPSAVIRGCDEGAVQPALSPPKAVRSSGGAAVECADGGVTATLERSSLPASMAEVRAATAGAIRAMSRHVSQVDFEAHGGHTLVKEGGAVGQLDVRLGQVEEEDHQSGTATNSQ